MMAKPRTAVSSVVALLALALLCSLPAGAQVAKQSNDTLTSLAFQSERLAPSQPFDSIDSVQMRDPLAHPERLAELPPHRSRLLAGGGRPADRPGSPSPRAATSPGSPAVATR